MTTETTYLVRDFGDAIRERYGRVDNRELLYTTPYVLYSALSTALAESDLPEELTDTIYESFVASNPAELRTFDTQMFHASQVVNSLEIALLNALKLEPVH